MPQTNDLRIRREAIHRIQIGLIGIAGILLVVTLANIVVKTARPDTSISGTTTAQTESATGKSISNATTANEPLADLGVTPTTEQATGTSDTRSSVPDLQPDPRLSLPMDLELDGNGGGKRPSSQ